MTCRCIPGPLPERDTCIRCGRRTADAPVVVEEMAFDGFRALGAVIDAMHDGATPQHASNAARLVLQK